MQNLSHVMENEAPLLACAIERAGSPPVGSEVRCSVLGCTHPSRLRLNGKGACGRQHLAILLRTVLDGEQLFAAKLALRTPHVLPVGALLLRNGAVTEPQLAGALRAQAATGAGKLGAWLRQQTGLSQAALTAALAAQQQCPVLALDHFEPACAMPLLPRPLLERFCAVPFSFSGAPRQLTLAFEDRGDPALLRAVQRIHGCEVRPGVLAATEFWEAMRVSLAARVSRVVEREAESAEAAAELLSHLLIQARARTASLAAVHDCLWLRFSRPDSAAPRDLLCTLARPEFQDSLGDSFTGSFEPESHRRFAGLAAAMVEEIS